MNHAKVAKDGSKKNIEISVKATGENGQHVEFSASKDDGAASFIAALKEDGLITENATVTYKDGQLTINGKAQDASVIAQYQQHLSGKSGVSFTISTSTDSK